MIGMVSVSNNPTRSGLAPLGVDVLQAGQCSACDALSAADDSLQGLPVLGATAAVPGSDARREHRPHSSGVEGYQQFAGDLEFPEPPEVE